MGRLRAFLVVCTAAAAGCSSAYGEQVTTPDGVAQGRPVEPVVQASQKQGPYTLEIMTKRGVTLPTHAHQGRFYIQGSVGARYIIRVANPTQRRIEAVVSVDGLDVIDGKAADFVSKRGYVVPAGGEVRIEGWRVSTSSVATFRFSSVSNSYAGRKGKPRNVGVIGVAIFEEKEAPRMIVQEPQRDPEEDIYFDDIDEGGNGDGDWDADDYWGNDSGATKSDKSSGGSPGRVAPRDNAPRGGGGASADRAEAERAPAPPRSRPSKRTTTTRGSKGKSRGCCTQRESRPGLGTEFGERRNSAVSWTRFQRNDLRVPDAVAELRYNDNDGLRAMGIAIENPVSWGEVETRETANPFPNSNFSSPPKR